MTETAAIDALMLLAQEGSSDKCRELLHAVTDLFLASETVTASQSALFDDVMTQVASEAGVEGRRDLAERIAPVGHAPRGIVNNLARDEDVSVASPVLKQSTVLTNEDLAEIAENHGDGEGFPMRVALARCSLARPRPGLENLPRWKPRGSWIKLWAKCANGRGGGCIRGAADGEAGAGYGLKPG